MPDFIFLVLRFVSYHNLVRTIDYVATIDGERIKIHSVKGNDLHTKYEE
jgi:hypothetical protein